jgi:Flp pilus assembly protein TadB
MSAKNAVQPSGEEQAAAGDEKSTSGNFSVKKSDNVGSEEQGGSIWSHLLFGVASLALVAPLFIPGIPMNILVVIYVALIGVVLVGCVIWNFLNTRPPKG